MSGFPAELLGLAYLIGYQDGFPELALLAEHENWNYAKSTSKNANPVLTNYVEYTYRRLVEENKIALSPDGQKLCFNTGLVTANQEEIFAYFTTNRFPDKQPWALNGWKKRSSHDLSVFSELPDVASYFEDPSSLLFDVRKELRVNVDHIIEENRVRFPAPYNTMELFALRNFLSGALEAVKIRVRRNYKTAIPQYYNGRMQLLLPVCLSSPSIADLALAIERYQDHYRASTCLTLNMAYNNARQLARPDRDWLQP